MVGAAEAYRPGKRGRGRLRQVRQEVQPRLLGDLALLNVGVHRGYRTDPLREDTARLRSDVDRCRDAVRALDDEDAAGYPCPIAHDHRERQQDRIAHRRERWRSAACDCS
jgi:hypothetical protein